MSKFKKGDTLIHKIDNMSYSEFLNELEKPYYQGKINDGYSCRVVVQEIVIIEESLVNEEADSIFYFVEPAKLLKNYEDELNKINK